MLLWASKFATAKIECSFEMGKLTPLGVTFILLAIVHLAEFSVTGLVKLQNYLKFSRTQISLYRCLTIYRDMKIITES